MKIALTDIPGYARALNELGLDQALGYASKLAQTARESREKPLAERSLEELASIIQAAANEGVAQFWNPQTIFAIQDCLREGEHEGLVMIMQRLGELGLMGSAWPPKQYSEEEVAGMKGAITKALDSIGLRLAELDQMMPADLGPPTVEGLTKQAHSLIGGIHEKYANADPEAIRGRVVEMVVGFAAASRVDLENAPPAKLDEYLAEATKDLLETYKLAKQFVSTFDAHKETYANILVDFARAKGADPAALIQYAAGLGESVGKFQVAAMAGRELKDKLLALQCVQTALVMAIDAILADGDMERNVRAAFRDPEAMTHLMKLFEAEGGNERIASIMLGLKKMGIEAKLPMA